MTPKAREGNRKRCQKWRQKNRLKYNAYLRKYRANHKWDRFHPILACAPDFHHGASASYPLYSSRSVHPSKRQMKYLTYDSPSDVIFSNIPMKWVVSKVWNETWNNLTGDTVPKGTKVERCYTKLKGKKGKSSAAAICQSSTRQSLKTGKKLRKWTLRRPRPYIVLALSIVGKSFLTRPTHWLW